MADDGERGNGVGRGRREQDDYRLGCEEYRDGGVGGGPRPRGAMEILVDGRRG